MKKYIFFDGKLLKRAGGPSTYLYNLKNGIEQIDKNAINFIYDESEEKTNENKLRSIVKKIITSMPKVYEKLLMQKRLKKGKIYDELARVKDGDVIMFHMTSDFAKAYKQLPKNCKKIVMSHSPEVAAKQMANDLKAKYPKYDFSYTEKKYYNAFDLPAFKNADIIVFPSKEAMEPYYQTIDNFDDIIKNKKIEYILTGTEKLSYKLEKKEFRKKYNIPNDAFVISFIGRHNLVKGYDNFISICTKFMEMHDNVYVITAGIGDIKSPDLKNWIDIGWTNDPGSVANASDVFILSNRRTYFDLVLLEMMSIGKTCLVSNTGGNKTVSKLSKGVITYNNIHEALEKLKILYSDKKKIDEYGVLNMKKYNEMFTVEAFSRRYIEMMEKFNKNNIYK